jgi:glycosyltransferase involved in cell wall biosynthesis
MGETIPETAERVLHVTTTLQTGGAETMLASLVLAKRPEAMPARVVSLLPGGRIYEKLRAAGIPVTDLGMTRGMPSITAVVKLARLIREERPAVIQGWTYHGDLLATLALLLSGRRRHTRLYWGVRCSDMDLSQYGQPLRIAVRTCALLSRIPDAIVANSVRGRDYHRAIGYRPGRFEVIANGIDTAKFHPDAAARARMRAEFGIGAEEPVLAMIARVDPMKDHGTFLLALERLPSVKALAIGLRTEALPIRPALHRLGLRDDVQELLAACDVVVSSSAYGEGFPNALAEGMACGLPAVATDVGDARRIVGDTGLVVPPRDPAALAEAIQILLREPPEKRAERGRQARRRIEEHFSLARAVAAFDALYDDVTPLQTGQSNVAPT